MSGEQKYTFHVHGMHCASCVVLTESELKDQPGVFSAKTSLETRSVELTGSFPDPSPETVASELTKVLSKHGYKLSTEAEGKAINWGDFKIAVPIALAFVLLFVLLQKLGIVNLISTGKVTYGTAFVVGIVASLSTCMAVVGGLVLSMSATFAKEGDKVRPQVLFHAGRVVAFFILGGVIGELGSIFQFGPGGMFALSAIMVLVMLILGINLLDIFHGAKKFQVVMPKFLAARALSLTKLNHTLTPALVGMATFFLPCGFTQSMQIFALTTGSFLRGGLTMLFFALGTLPILSLVSFSSLSIQNSSKSGIFFKSAGIIVILFAIFNLINSLVAIGWINPVFNF